MTTNWENKLFTMESQVYKNLENVSIVYTWVNGSVPDYRALRGRYGGRHHVGGSRDRDSDELKHSFRSIEKFMPWWKGKLFLVTPGMYPSWINRNNPRIVLIDQNDIIPPQARNLLPSFSTNALEFFFYNIPGLTDVFIYMNDDNFLGRQAEPWHFFTPDGGARFFFDFYTNISCDSSFYDASQVYYTALCNTHGALIDRYGRADRFKLQHAPFVIYKNAYEKLFERWEQDIYQTLLHRFRNPRDVIFHYLHHHFILNEGYSCCNFTAEIEASGDVDENILFYVLTDDPRSMEAMIEVITATTPRFFTINDNFKKNETIDRFKKFLGTIFPIPSAFEITPSKAEIS